MLVQPRRRVRDLSAVTARTERDWVAALTGIRPSLLLNPAVSRDPTLGMGIGLSEVTGLAVVGVVAVRARVGFANHVGPVRLDVKGGMRVVSGLGGGWERFHGALESREPVLGVGDIAVTGLTHGVGAVRRRELRSAREVRVA